MVKLKNVGVKKFVDVKKTFNEVKYLIRFKL